MNWGIYEKRKKTIIWAFIINLGLLIVILSLPKIPNCGDHPKSAKLKSRLKQISLTVAMYFHDQENLSYPINPSKLKIEPRFFYTDKTNDWFEINLNSPYYFFPDENHLYTGSPKVPIATNWEPILRGRQEYFAVAWEDGHVSQISRKEQLKLFHSTYKGRVSKELYDLLSKNNQALQ
ncbi:MAG: hypothetical protein NE328_20545 [Lentisphaeraceae bacterium]|nr:hypothetical protein [Lentisphaeraceae bacterium]